MEPVIFSQALSRIKHYCSYQERCHSEVKSKLYNLGVHGEETDKIIAQLIAENYLNEERFAIQFAGGRFRLKNWGKHRIESELKLRKVSDYCIRKALRMITDEDHESTFLRLAEKKKTSLKSEKNIFIKKRKIKDFLLSKGYPYDMINAYLAKI